MPIAQPYRFHCFCHPFFSHISRNLSCHAQVAPVPEAWPRWTTRYDTQPTDSSGSWTCLDSRIQSQASWSTCASIYAQRRCNTFTTRIYSRARSRAAATRVYDATWRSTTSITCHASIWSRLWWAFDKSLIVNFLLRFDRGACSTWICAICSVEDRSIEYAGRRVLDSWHCRELRGESEGSAQTESTVVRTQDRGLQVVWDSAFRWQSHIRCIRFSWYVQDDVTRFFCSSMHKYFGGIYRHTLFKSPEFLFSSRGKFVSEFFLIYILHYEAKYWNIHSLVNYN